MIKSFKPVLLAVSIGCASAFVIFRSVEQTTIVAAPGNAVAIQLGVFKDENTALAMQEKCGGEVFNTDGVYRLYFAILSSDDNIDFVKSYLKEQGISYYLKTLSIDGKKLKEGIEYESVMKKSSKSARLSLNKELLNMYKEVI
ncbi:MAG TPA: hypothetical protein DCY94_01485 [Firmicutes bacterium]|nr:hypothetical protein [Bacillota bacterium]